MITEAHVGVGIRGLEGQQASRSADYAIGEFKLLQRLMFFHGRECYRKNSNLILYCLYKNVLLNMPNFWFGMTHFLRNEAVRRSRLSTIQFSIYIITNRNLRLVRQTVHRYSTSQKSDVLQSRNQACFL